jgi:hypothetical protein
LDSTFHTIVAHSLLFRRACTIVPKPHENVPLLDQI